MNDTECKSEIIRISCLKCACKHVAQCRVLLLEQDNYPAHYWFAMGHLAEAEDELREDYPIMAEFIRDQRLLLQHDKFHKIEYKTIIDILVSIDNGTSFLAKNFETFLKEHKK